jgi:hypothetical protein
MNNRRPWAPAERAENRSLLLAQSPCNSGPGVVLPVLEISLLPSPPEAYAMMQATLIATP